MNATDRREYKAAWERAKRAQNPEAVRARQREYEQGRSEERAAWKRAYRLANLAEVQEQGRRSQKKATDERREVVNAIKTKRGCADCGYSAHHAALDFDHIDRVAKTKTVAWLVSHAAPWSELLAEMEKCEVVCANCHRVRTYEREDWRSAVRREAGRQP